MSDGKRRVSEWGPPDPDEHEWVMVQWSPCGERMLRRTDTWDPSTWTAFPDAVWWPADPPPDDYAAPPEPKWQRVYGGPMGGSWVGIKGAESVNESDVNDAIEVLEAWDRGELVRRDDVAAVLDEDGLRKALRLRDYYPTREEQIVRLVRDHLTVIPEGSTVLGPLQPRETLPDEGGVLAAWKNGTLIRLQADDARLWSPNVVGWCPTPDPWPPTVEGE